MPTITPIPFGGGAPHSTGFAGTFVAAAIGAVTLLAAPWFTRGVVSVDRWLIRALLGPGQLAERVRSLEESRALAVDDSAALLRRLERDLHDGAQVRLVALAMSLDMAKERLGREGEPVADPARVRQLVDTAHRNATEALAELRDLARGIHPPALDDGLPDALSTLAARSTVPVELSVDVPQRPTCGDRDDRVLLRGGAAHQRHQAQWGAPGGAAGGAGGRVAAAAGHGRRPRRGDVRRRERVDGPSAAGADGGRAP